MIVINVNIYKLIVCQDQIYHISQLIAWFKSGIAAILYFGK